MITYYKSLLKNPKLRRLKKFENGCWIHVVDPSEKELEELHTRFKLDKQNLISGLDKHEVPRVEFIDDEIYVILKIIPSSDAPNLHTFLIVVTDKFILTLSKHNPAFIDKILNGQTKYDPAFIEKILKGHIEFITTQKLKCLIRLLSMINKDFEVSTLRILKSVSSMRESVHDLTEKEITSLLEQESTLNSFVSAYNHTNLVYERIMQNVKFYEEDKKMIEDLIIDAKQGFESCKSSLKTISNIRNNFVILLSNKLNRTITLLTIFTIFVTIPAAIAGIYGMNVKLPLGDNPNAFYFVLSFICLTWLVLSLFFIWYFKRGNSV